MKRILAIFACLFIAILGGCAASEGGNDLKEYTAEASQYLEKAADFAKEASLKAEEAVHDEQAKEELKSKLEEMKNEIKEFSKVEAPKVADGFHRNVVEKSAVLEDKIDLYLNRINQGKLDEEFLDKEDLKKPVEELKKAFTDLKENINEK
ncbi:DUF6376 family protein [Bacillus sp. B-jedd]|uniref:DUF6376 family protein n=1 Tax=Bacillus sp. B-jedd TaxID=1476857 RepID=UPI00051565D7|nr:DUF6376 family protein [Bacillus sp. B-jedd]CEG27430.1 putative lipoprotein [Bacillus sp. B-jedd]